MSHASTSIGRTLDPVPSCEVVNEPTEALFGNARKGASYLGDVRIKAIGLAEHRRIVIVRCESWSLEQQGT